MREGSGRLSIPELGEDGLASLVVQTGKLSSGVGTYQGREDERTGVCVLKCSRLVPPAQLVSIKICEKGGKNTPPPVSVNII